MRAVRSSADRAVRSRVGTAALRRRHLGRRRHLPLSRLRQVGRGLQEGDRHRAELPVDRLGRRHQADQGQAPSTFGASDKPLEAEGAQETGLVQWPMIMGGVVPAVNIKGVQARRARPRRPDAGRRSTWARSPSGTTPKIKALNPSVELPRPAIAPVYRSDGSGTNFLFTTYLSKRRARVQGQGRGRHLGAVAGRHRRQGQRGRRQHGQADPGAIGYVEYAYVKQNKMTYAKLKNRDGQGRRSPSSRQPSRPPPPTPTGPTRRASTRSWPTSPATRAGRSPAPASS